MRDMRSRRMELLMATLACLLTAGGAHQFTCCHCTAVACNSSRNVILCCGHLKFSIISKNFTCRCRCRCRSRCRVYSPSAQFQCSAKVGVNSWPRFSSSTAFQNFASPAVKIYPVRMAHCWLAGWLLAGCTFTVLLIPIRVQM